MALTDDTPKYVYGLGLTYDLENAGNVQVYHTDGLGSVRAITNLDDLISVIETDQTDAFGIPTQTQGGITQPFQFTGQQRDASTALYDLRARMYDPTIGRFLEGDPLAGVAAAPQSLNRFVYAGNNPVSSVDPSGLKNQAALPGPCLFQTVFGGFICSSVFCSEAPSPASQRKKTYVPKCPNADSGASGPAVARSVLRLAPVLKQSYGRWRKYERRHWLSHRNGSCGSS